MEDDEAADRVVEGVGGLAGGYTLVLDKKIVIVNYS